MRKYFVLAATAVTFFSASMSVAIEAMTPIGHVTRLTGHAWGIESQRRAELKVGSALYQGERIETDARSQLHILLGKDVAALIKEKSSVLLEQKDGKDWVLRLNSGSVLSAVANPEKRPNHYAIRTRTAVMGVRGTVFFVKVQPDKPVFLCTCNGKVVVSSLDGKTTHEISSIHHDSPELIAEGPGGIEERMQTAGVGEEHTDAEAAVLQKDVGR